MVSIRGMTASDWEDVAHIYKLGIDKGFATFETEIPSWNKWDSKYIQSCRLVAVDNDRVVGYAVLSPVSSREVYKGVAEVSVYVHPDFHSKGIGKSLLSRLIEESEKEGFWTLQAGIFPQNHASVKLHLNCGFRLIGTKEKIGKLGDIWYDNLFFERRSKKTGI